MAQSTLETITKFCSLCNGYYNNDMYKYHLNTKYHQYATCENDSQHCENSNLVPIAGTQAYCIKCCTVFDVVQRHKCQYEESDYEENLKAISKWSYNKNILFRTFKYYGKSFMICLLCTTIEMGLVENHEQSQEHKGNMIDNYKQVRLDQFYSFFTDFDPYVVDTFMPYSMERVQCLKCMEMISYTEVQLHNNCTYNSFRVTDICLKLPINTLFHWNNELDYDERILNMFYPKRLMKIVFKFDKTPIYVAQKTAGSIKCLFCCVEGIIGDEQVVEHFTSFAHLTNSNNIVFNQALSTYHHFFALSAVGDQMRHHLFEPSSLDAVTCLLCQTLIVFSEIKDHNCSQQIESTSSDEAVDAASLNRMILDYSEGDIFQKVCLCCELIFNSDVAIADHVKSKKHMRAVRLNGDVVDLFLEFWRLEPRKEQKYFFPLNFGQFKCIQCKRPVNIPIVFSHAKKCIPALYKDSLKLYTESVMKALYPKFETDKDCIFQKRNSFVFCLYCLETFQGSVSLHSKDPNHLKMIHKPKKIQMVETYHNYWMYESEELQFRQICFNPTSVNSALCIWCNRSFSYKNLSSHNCMKLSLIDIQLLNGQFTYCAKVMEEVYPDGNFVVQISNNKTICLFCNANISGTPKLHLDGKSHMNKIRNNERVQAVLLFHRFWLSRDDEQQIEQLKYLPFDHKFMQCNNCKLLFNYDVLETHNCDSSKGEVRMRYNRDILSTVYPHMNVYNPINYFFVQQIGVNLYNCLFCRTEFSTSINEHCRLVRHKTNSLSKLCINALLAYHQYWLKSGSSKDQIHFTTHSDENVRCSRCDVVVLFEDIATHECPKKKSVKLPKNVYCNEVLFSIYSHLESDRMEDLYLQKLKRNTYQCLYCCVVVKQHWDKHVAKHLSEGKTPNTEALKQSMMCYHKFWVSQSNDIQMKQINYFPYDMENGICVLCATVVQYGKTMFDHKCDESSENKCDGSSENKCDESTKNNCSEEEKETTGECSKTLVNVGPVQKYEGPSKIHALVKNELYPQDLDAVVRNSHLQFKFPIFQKRSSKMICMLCMEAVKNNKDKVNEHLIKAHPIINHRLVSQAIHVIAYHKHFETQPIDSHYLQSYYRPGGTRTADCIRLHRVQFSKLEFHYRKCSTPGDRKLQSDMNMLANEDKRQKPNVKISNQGDKFANRNLMKQQMKAARNDCHEMVAVPKNEFPLRLQYQSDFFYVELAPSRKVHCKYCEIDLEDFSDVFKHIIDEKHSVLMRTTKHMFLYLCDICRFKTKKEIDWQKHFLSSGHLNMYNSIGEIRQTTLSEYECNVCSYVLYGDNMSVFEHKEGLAGLKPNKHIRNREQNDKKLRSIFANEKSTEKYLEEMRAECEPVDSPGVVLCLQEIKEHLQTKYHNCKVHPFGSRAIEIGNLSSDLDVFADLNNFYYGGVAHQQLKIVREVTRLLKLRPDLFQCVFSIPTARTPIIRFMHANTEVNCDLSFINGLSVENTRFIKFCYELQPIGRDAILLLRSFGTIECLYTEYKICSYAFSMMLLFYMQIRGWLLSIHRLRELTNKDVKMIDGWPIIEYNKPVEVLRSYVKQYTGSVYSLVKEFFEYYNNFNYEEDVVCPFMGNIIKRKQFNNDGATLPTEMSIYKENLKDESFRFEDCFMCVQDPFDLSHNLTKAVSNDAVASFKFKCRNVMQMFKY